MDASLSLRRYGREPLAHSHPHHQIVLPLSGALDIDIDGRGERLARDRMASIACGAVHAFSAHGANRFVVVDLPTALAEAVLPRVDAFLPLPPGAGRNALDLMRSGGGPAAIRRWLAACLSATPGGDALRRIEASMQWMRERPWEMHDTVALAAAVGLRRSHFHSLFVAATGLTPRRWLGELRLDRAEALLRESDLSLADIALACGYSEQSALTRALQRERGVTPSEMRRGRR